MRNRNATLFLFFAGFFSALLLTPAARAIDDWTLVDECQYAGCDGWDCITWGRGDDQRFCWCTHCEDYTATASEGIYQTGQEQYVCGAVPKGSSVVPKCVPFPVQIKKVDLNDARGDRTDKAAIDEIIRLKTLGGTQTQTTSPTTLTAPSQRTPTLFQKLTTPTK